MLMKRLVPLVALLLIGCGRGCTSVPTSHDSGSSPSSATENNGLTGQELDRWHHLAEGSEVYPLSWILALQNDGGQPFLSNPERFGLLPDPVKTAENPYGLPIGLTAAESRDLQPLFPKFQMIGVNCAACHVNEIHYKGKAVMRIDGAPNLFDLGSFCGSLAQDTLATVESTAKAWDFAQRLYQVYHPKEHAFAAAVASGTTPPPKEALGEFSTLDKDLAARIKDLHEQQLAQPVIKIHKGLADLSRCGTIPGHLKIPGIMILANNNP
jgi:hypothetical protein